MVGDAMSTRCPGRARHWRIAFRAVGLRTPVCVYCGSPNPRPLKDWEWEELASWARNVSVGDQVRTALEAHFGKPPEQTS